MKQKNGHRKPDRQNKKQQPTTAHRRARKTVERAPVKKQKKKSFFTPFRITIIALVALLVLICAYIFLTALPDRDKGPHPFESKTGFLASFKTSDANPFWMDCSTKTFFKSATPPVSLDGVIRNEHAYNILVVGKDRVGLNTDVMMVINFNSATQKVNLLQIPRDTYVEDTANRYGGNKRMNAVFAYWLSQNRRSYETEADAYNAGIAYLEKTIESTFGITIDKYCMIDLNGFVKMIDAIGGVPMNVPSNMYYVDEEQGLYINIKKGEQVLTGTEAEGFVRFRSGYAMGDLGRVDAQKLFLAALMEKLTSSDWYSLDKLTEIAGLVVENCTTNLSLKDIVGYLRLIDFGTLGANSMTFYTAAGEGFTSAGGASMYSLYMKENLEIINKAFNLYNIDVQPEHVTLIEQVKSGYWNPNTSGLTTGELEGNHPHVWQPTSPSVPDKPETSDSDETDEPLNPDEPINPDTPTDTEEPLDPEAPFNPDDVENPDEPVSSDADLVPIEPEIPDEPLSSDADLVPIEPEIPDETEGDGETTPDDVENDEPEQTTDTETEQTEPEKTDEPEIPATWANIVPIE